MLLSNSVGFGSMKVCEGGVESLKLIQDARESHSRESEVYEKYEGISFEYHYSPPDDETYIPATAAPKMNGTNGPWMIDWTK